MSRRNLLKETTENLSRYSLTPTDVRWVGGERSNWDDRSKAEFCGSWEQFAALADFDYDAGFGSEEVNSHLHVVGDDWWLERHEYDGSEWWEFKRLPVRPAEPVEMTADDLKSH